MAVIFFFCLLQRSCKVTVSYKFVLLFQLCCCGNSVLISLPRGAVSPAVRSQTIFGSSVFCDVNPSPPRLSLARALVRLLETNNWNNNNNLTWSKATARDGTSEYVNEGEERGRKQGLHFQHQGQLIKGGGFMVHSNPAGCWEFSY